MKTERCPFESVDGVKLVGIADLPDNYKSKSIVVTAHGMDSSKNSDKWREIGQRFPDAGFGVFRFDFRDCGESGHTKKPYDFIGKRSDLVAAVNYVKKEFKPAAVGLMGSSAGGVLALLHAADDKGIGALVTLATPYHKDDEDAIKRITCPTLIIHGDADESISSEDAWRIYNRIPQTTPQHLEIIEGGDHRFSDPHLRDKVIGLSLNWFKKYLVNI